MQQKRAISFLVMLLFVLFEDGYSLNKIIFSDAKQLLKIGGSVEILEDPHGRFPADSLFRTNGFTPSSNEVPNLGITASTFWLKFEVGNNSDNDELILELAYPIIDEVTLYYKNIRGELNAQTYGEIKAFEERKYDHQNYLFDLYLPAGTTDTFLIAVKSGEQILTPLNIGTEQVIFEHNLIKDLISGFYFGIIFVMAFYNLFIFLSTRDISYLYYILYIGFVGIVQASFQGYAFKFLWPGSTWLAIHGIYFVSALSGIFGMIFMKEFIRLPLYSKKLVKGVYILTGLYVICLAFTISGNFDIGFNLMNLTAMSVSLYMIYSAWFVSRKGYRPARFFLWAQTIFLLGVVIFVFRNLGILPYNDFTYYILQIGSGIEVIVLSIALADRINILTREKEASQAQALAASMENEKIIKEQNIVLEQTVEKRTQELRNTNQDLNVAMTNLKDAQSQLVSAEKMASLGQLTAGIAHEINNPINFVTSSVKPLKQNISELIQILHKYEELNENSELKEKLIEIEKLKEELEMDYLLQEINEIIESIDEGAQRTAEIVQGLRNFSHVDDIGVKDNDLNKGIKSTLKLLRSELDNLELKLELGTIPKVECYGGKMNQVFLNIINNSVQAIKKNGQLDGIVRISTKAMNDSVSIEIEDNGPGIPEEILDKIFDPFFTTKDVGEGTGLGLSVVYGIIEQHKGSIKVESEVGKGTKFIVTLPVSQG